jgi:acetyl esterase
MKFSGFLALLIPSLFPSGLAAQMISRPLGEARIYKTVNGRSLKVHVLLPEGWTPRDRRPAIVLFHGGGWVKGTPSALNDQADFLRSRGMVCFLAEYRLTDRMGTPEPCIKDAKSALRWVRSRAAEWGIDAQRLAAGGGSAGAHLAAATALLPGFDEPGEDRSVSPRPQALILLNPVIDNGPEGYGAERFPGRYRAFSPAHNVGPGAPPTLILSGTADETVPVSLLQKFSEAMQAAGVRCDLRLYEGGGHGFYRKSDHGGKFFPLVLADMEVFLRSLGWLPEKPR